MVISTGIVGSTVVGTVVVVTFMIVAGGAGGNGGGGFQVFIKLIFMGSCKNFSKFFRFLLAAYSHSPGSYESTGTKIYKKIRFKNGQKD